MRLNEQCDDLGLPLTRIELPRAAEGWVVSDRPHRRPECAAAELLRSEGWTCATCEGGPILLLMKAASLEFLMSVNRLGAEDSLTRFFEAQVTINRERLDDISEAIGSCDTRTVVTNFEHIYAAGVDQYYPGVTVSLIEQLHLALGAKLVTIFQHFSADAYCYRAGWPDLTAVRGSDVLFREVKTSDKLHASQIETFREVLKPCGLSADVIQLVKAKAL